MELNHRLVTHLDSIKCSSDKFSGKQLLLIPYLITINIYLQYIIEKNIQANDYLSVSQNRASYKSL